MLKFTACSLCLLLLFSGAACTDNSGVHEQMVDLTEVKDDPEILLSSLNAAIKRSGNNADLFARRAALYIRKGEYERSLEDASKAVSLSGNSPENLFLKAQVLRALKREGDALKLALQAERNGYENELLYVLLSDLYFKLGQYESAKFYNNQAYELSPSNEFVLYYRGRIASATGDTATAINSFQKALKESPKLFELNRDLAGIYVARNDMEQAELYLDRALQLDSTDGIWWYYQGRLFQKAEKTDSAAWSYRNAVQRADSLLAAHRELGYINYTRGRYDQAVSHLEKAAGANSNTVRFLTTLASSYEHLGQDEKALAQYEKLVNLEPKYTYAYQKIARLRSRLESFEPESLDLQKVQEEEF